MKRIKGTKCARLLCVCTDKSEACSKSTTEVDNISKGKNALQ